MDKKLVALIALFFVSFAFFTAAIVFKEPIVNLTRAKEDLEPSPVRSKILAWPLSYIMANGASESVISVFVISESDRPLANRLVTLSNSLGKLDKATETTNKSGKATFKLTSNAPGKAEIEATVEPDIKIASKISISFE